MSNWRSRPIEGLTPVTEHEIELRWPSEDKAIENAINSPAASATPRLAAGIDMAHFQNVDTNLSSKKLRGFYSKQNALIAMMKAHVKAHRFGTSDSWEGAELGRAATLDDDNDDDSSIHLEVSDSHALVQSAILLSFGCNVLLLVTKGWMALVTGSMSILASAADSLLDLLDLLAGAVLLLTERATHNVDHYKYPEGRARIEPIGVIIFATVLIFID